MNLIIANKCHSSWSLRPWLLLTHFEIPFEETLIPFGPTFDDPAWKARVVAYTPAGKVPALVDGDIHVWDSLAIIEYVADKFPQLPIWPRDRAARAHARAIACEMHSGFLALRRACPMNFGFRHPARDRGPQVAADVARIVAIWRDCRARHGADGPFLFGAFSAADAMFAPVTQRIIGYSIPLDLVCEAYVAAVQATPAFRAWREAALAESWIVPEDEVDEPVLDDFRPHLRRDPGRSETP